MCLVTLHINQNKYRAYKFAKSARPTKNKRGSFESLKLAIWTDNGKDKRKFIVYDLFCRVMNIIYYFSVRIWQRWTNNLFAQSVQKHSTSMMKEWAKYLIITSIVTITQTCSNIMLYIKSMSQNHAHLLDIRVFIEVILTFFNPAFLGFILWNLDYCYRALLNFVALFILKINVIFFIKNPL